MQPVPLTQIEKKIMRHFGVRYRSSLYKRYHGRNRKHAMHKHIFVYTLWHYSDMNAAGIGEKLQVDRTIVYNSLERINKKCQQDPQFKSQLILFESLFE